MNNPYSKNNHCKCGRLIQNTSKNCHSCHMRNEGKKQFKNRRSYVENKIRN